MGLSEIHGEIPIQPVVPHQFSHQHYVYRGFPPVIHLPFGDGLWH